MKLSNKGIVRLCDMLISYHMKSFRIRRKGLLDVDLAPKIVMELDNLRYRLGNEWKVEDAHDQAIGFNHIIQMGKEEISRQREMAQSADDAKPHLERAQTLMEEMSAAKYLMELMTDG